jgi:methionyl-tRNA formyltransferase
MNVLLVGEGAAGTQALKALAAGGHRVVAVMAAEPPANDGHGSVWSLAHKLGYVLWPAQLVKDPSLVDRIRAGGVDLLLNVFSLYIIRSEVLEAPRLGSFNLHPGPLPRYAGLNSMCWAIYNGETAHGVTLHKMVPRVDAGPIVFQQAVEITEEDTGLSLAVKCIRAGMPLVERLLEIANTKTDAIPLLSQNPSQRTYFGAGPPQNGRLCWDRPARDVFNFVRACNFAPFRSPWGQPRARRNGQELLITKVSLTGKACSSVPGTVGQVDEAGAEVACRDEWLMVPRLASGGESRSAAELLKRGDRLQD